MKEKVLSLPTAFGTPLELYKNTWGDSNQEPFIIVSGLQGDHLNGMYVSSRLSQFLDSVCEGINSDYTLEGQVISFPMVNLNAIQSGSRLAPYDGMDMDLAFPGNLQGETAEALASAVLKHTTDACWGLILQSPPPHYEDAPHIQTLKLDGRTKQLTRDLNIETVRKLNESVNLHSHWHSQGVIAAILSSGSPRIINLPQCETLFQGIVNFMVAEGILKDKRKSKFQKILKAKYYQPGDEVTVPATKAGMFLKGVKAGSHLKKGQRIGEVLDLYSGKTLEEITAPADGLLLTLRQYPIVYEKELLATLLTTKKSWRDLLLWPG